MLVLCETDDNTNLHAFFLIKILFTRITRLKSGKNKINLRITKAQILPKDELTSWAELCQAQRCLVWFEIGLKQNQFYQN